MRIKSILLTFCIIGSLATGCFYNDLLIEASVCPDAEDGQHIWDMSNGIPEWSLDNEQKQDCTKGLVYYRQCWLCLNYELRRVSPTKHKWLGWEVKNKATHFKKGKKYRECKLCDVVQKKTIKKKKMNNNQKGAKKAVIKYIRSAKKYNVGKMNQMFIDKKSVYGYPQKAPLPTLYRKKNKKIKYKLIELYGKRKDISVSVDIWIPNMHNAIYSAMKDEYYELLDSGSTKLNIASSRLVNRYIKKVKKSKGKLKKTRVIFKMRKISRGWKIKKKTRRMVDIATGFYASGSFDAEIDYY